MKKKTIIKKILGFTVFMFIIAIIFSNITWIFRGNGTEAREDILGFKNEKNKIDVILFGGSDVLRFYEPLEAWNTYGYTSYNYATPAARVDMLRFYAEETRKTNEADLYVFDIRTITLVNDTISESSLRNWSDSVSVFSGVRARGIASYLFSRDWSGIDLPSYFLDIIEYHTNYESLSNSYQWKYINQSDIYNVDKGFGPYVNHTPFDKPVITDEKSELSEIQEESIIKLLDYCDDEGINALFICSPIVIKEADEQLLNTIGEVIEDRGYEFVDFNKYYDEIGIDFEVDFGDVNHINYIGAQKFTEYFAAYLENNYKLPDHRGDEDYASWDEDYLSMKETKEGWLSTVTNTINSHMDAKEIGESLKDIENIDEWLDLISNSNFTVIVKKNEAWADECADQYLTEFFTRYEIDAASDLYIGIWNGDQCLFASTDGAPADVEIGVDNGRGSDQCIVNVGHTSKLSIAGNDYDMNKSGIQIVVYDNNYKNVVDNVFVGLENGAAIISR